MNGSETHYDLLVVLVLTWLSSGIISVFLAYLWARRPFDLKHVGSSLLLGPVTLVAVAVLSAGYFIISPWADSRAFSLASPPGRAASPVERSDANIAA